MPYFRFIIIIYLAFWMLSCSQHLDISMASFYIYQEVKRSGTLLEHTPYKATILKYITFNPSGYRYCLKRSPNDPDFAFALLNLDKDNAIYLLFHFLK